MTKYRYHTNGDLPPEKTGWCFVYGSNRQGVHGKGAALIARQKYNAQLGQGEGFSPNLTSYAVPTKNTPYETLSLHAIKEHVDLFIKETYNHPDLYFWVTALGTGLAGYQHSQIAPLFKTANTNCSFPTEWQIYLE